MYKGVAPELYVRMYASVKGRYPNKILTENIFQYLNDNPEGYNRDNYLTTLVSYLKYMNEDDINFWAIDVVDIIRRIESIYGETNLLEVLREGGKGGYE